MNILVDTHILVWVLMISRKLSKTQRDLLEDQNNIIYVSSISLWELSIKISANKFKFENFDYDDIENILVNEYKFKILPTTTQEYISFFKLPKFKDKDPFDRMLIWQSIQNGLFFMSSDRLIKEYEKFGLKTV